MTESGFIPFDGEEMLQRRRVKTVFSLFPLNIQRLESIFHQNSHLINFKSLPCFHY